MAASYQRVYAFVDGGNLRSGLESIGAKWNGLNVSLACHVAIDWIGREWERSPMRISRVFLYDAIGEAARSDLDQWLEGNDALADTHVRRGRVVGEGDRMRQKAVDISLAVDALSFAARGLYDVALIFSGDGDFVPLVDAIRGLGPLVCICSFKKKMSDDLRRVADRVGYAPEDPAAWDAWRLPKKDSPL